MEQELGEQSVIPALSRDLAQLTMLLSEALPAVERGVPDICWRKFRDDRLSRGAGATIKP